ncbi:hypothetical protein JKF63_04553 [Porcisia hertigi]|uniref:protein-tyrosine-phosphatase n=1 Tax=Porcisia hertigi TaxID=2761500 RepID=A0A836IF76_9TRYP|nr:hypothetical protein JKF63_04553 [Porcisia hertigi]
MKVIPPNFGYVEEGIFRCGAPEPRHYGFLSSLGLRTCILLTENHDEAFVHWLQESEVTIFCPLASKSQAYGTFHGVAQAYSPATPAHVPNRGDIHQGSGGRSATRNAFSGTTNVKGVKGGNPKEEGREGAAAASSGVDPSRPHLGTPNNGNNSQGEGDGWPDGNVDGREGDRSVSIGARDWYTASTGTATPGTSNAVRFLQENVGEGQVSSKFSVALLPEPLYFPHNRSGYSVSGGVDLEAAVPSYEGKLHGLMTLSEAVVVSILHIMLDPQYYPLLITCSKGRYRSGIVCGCLRKLQRWNLVSILEEYRRFAGNKSRADNEEFIELFDEELVSLELSGGRRPTILYNA